MKAVRRLAALLVCATLSLGLFAHASSSSGVYFMAVNDRMHEMTPENMPMVVNGTLYVPYTMLSVRHTGLNLGVTAQYSTSRRTVLVSGDDLAVTFDLQANNATDAQGELLEGVQAAVRNSMAFIPLAWVCSYFGTIRYTVNRTPYGTLIRVTNNAVVLSDPAFIDAATSQIRDNLASYEQAIAAQQPSSQPEPSAQPDPSPSPVSGPDVYLAFLAGDGADQVARQLESLSHRGLFFFTPQQLAGQDDLVRRLVGAGHAIGLDLTAATDEDCLEQAQQGAQLLADIAFSPAYIVRATELDGTGLDLLRQAGWAVWSATLRGEEGFSASQLLGQLSYSRDNFLELTCTQADQSAIYSLLRSLAGSGYQLHSTTAVTLS